MLIVSIPSKHDESKYDIDVEYLLCIIMYDKSRTQHDVC